MFDRMLRSNVLIEYSIQHSIQHSIERSTEHFIACPAASERSEPKDTCLIRIRTHTYAPTYMRQGLSMHLCTCPHGLYSYGLYSYGLYSYDNCIYAHVPMHMYVRMPAHNSMRMSAHTRTSVTGRALHISYGILVYDN